MTLMLLELANTANRNLRLAVLIEAETGQRFFSVIIERTKGVDKRLRIHKRIRY